MCEILGSNDCRTSSSRSEMIELVAAVVAALGSATLGSAMLIAVVL